MRRHQTLRVVWAIGLAFAASTVMAAAQSASSATDRATARATAFVDRLMAQDIHGAEAMFDPTMKGMLPADRLQATWAGVIAQVGNPKKRDAARAVNAGTGNFVVIVTCEFDRTSLDLQMGVDPSGQITGFFIRPAAMPPSASAPAPSAESPPSYADPGRYAEADVVVKSGSWQLPATLTLPVGAGPFPAIVLVHGSGPNDRDETLGPNKPFRDLALGLASRGIGVLRYEKRTRQYGAQLLSAGSAGFTVKDETIDDAVAAVALLAGDRRIDRGRIVVLGHSLGGMLIPRIAEATSGAAGFIIMAGATRSLEQAILDQTEYLVHLNGPVSPDGRRQIDAAESLVSTIRAIRPEDAASPALVGGAPASYWLDLRGYDPAVAARRVTRPMLILQGGRDYQVTMDDFAQWKASLSDRSDVTFKSYPSLNHLFIAGTGPSTPQEYDRPGHVDADVIGDIAAWMDNLAHHAP